MEGNSELMLVVAVIGGLIAGFLVGWLSRSSEGGKGEELERCREELERYRNEVGGHFAKTAELVGKMTAQYRAVYEHLAEGAHRLGGEQAKHLEAALKQRFAECGLELHPHKTRIVYCKDDDRRQAYALTTFDFLGYTFRPRRSKNR